MKYEITVIADKDGKNLSRKVIIIESKELLTVKEVKTKCLADAAVDTTKSTVTLEEIWLSNSSRVKEAAADDLVLTERNERVDYYLSLTPVEAAVEPAKPAKPAKTNKPVVPAAPKTKAAKPAPVETPAVEPVVVTVETVETPEETK